MNLLQIVSYLKQIALSSPYIRTAEEGSVYTIMNGNPHSKYSVFVVSQTQHRQDEIFDYYGLNLFVIDRLVDDLESNRLQTQSLAKEVLTNTILTLESKFYGITHNELQFHPFTEKFVDLTAGQYVQVTFQVPRNLICPDTYGLDFPSNYKLLPLNVEITENGVYEYSPVADFDGYDSVTLTINVPQSGYTQEDLDNAYASGETHQKSLLQDIEITHNGEYQVENGFDKVTVNVPQTGQTIYNQTKNIEYSGNGEYTVTYDEGYTGLEGVNITVNVPQSAYTSGYTQEDLDNAYISGETHQKSLLEDITITENGEYTSINGYSAITVNVPQSGYTQEDLDNAYASGITSGETYQKSKLISTAITVNGTYTRADGFNQVTVYIPSGQTIKNQFKTVNISANTTTIVTFDSGYTGLAAVSIITDVSGYTQQDLDNAYNSGYTDGFEDGFESGLTYCNGVLNIIIQSDELEGLVDVAEVEVTYSGISTTYTYTGGTISIDTLPGVEYRVVYLRAEGYKKPASFSFISRYKENLTYYGYYEKLDPIIYDKEYLTFDIISAGTITWLGANNEPEEAHTIDYSKDYGDTWVSIVSTGDTITVESGDLVKFRGNSDTYRGSVYFSESHFHNDCEMNIYGNIMSMIYEDNFSGETTLVSAHTFGHFFAGTKVIDSSNLVLPATTITEGCYEGMFDGCSGLTAAPQLPATTLARSCYHNMFYDCSSLTAAPTLPATTCKPLCYSNMFNGCTSLNYIKCMATSGINANSSTSNWVSGVAATGTFTKKSGVNWPTGNNGIPENWTVTEE